MFFCGIDCFNGLGMSPTWFDRYESTALLQWSVSILHNSDYAVAFQIRIVVLSEISVTSQPVARSSLATSPEVRSS
jgi:hypothetical protein